MGEERHGAQEIERSKPFRHKISCLSDLELDQSTLIALRLRLEFTQRQLKASEI